MLSDLHCLNSEFSGCCNCFDISFSSQQLRTIWSSAAICCEGPLTPKNHLYMNMLDSLAISSRSIMVWHSNCNTFPIANTICPIWIWLSIRTNLMIIISTLCLFSSKYNKERFSGSVTAVSATCIWWPSMLCSHSSAGQTSVYQGIYFICTHMQTKRNFRMYV